MSTSTDGGLTWGPPKSPRRPAVGSRRPAGRRSPTGTWSCRTTASVGHPGVPLEERRRQLDSDCLDRDVIDHGVAGESAHVAASLGRGRCGRARSTSSGRTAASGSGCSSNDIVMTHLDGRESRGRPGADPDRSVDERRRPLHPRASRVDRSTSGSTARLALAYYYYPVAALQREHMRPHRRLRLLDRRRGDVDAPRTVAGPFKLAWLAPTDQGPMVGDYISTSFAGGPLAFAVFAIAKPPTNGVFNERAASREIRRHDPAGRSADPGATRPDPVPRARVSESPARARR